MRSFKSNENIHKKEGGSYYVVSANKASSVTLYPTLPYPTLPYLPYCTLPLPLPLPYPYPTPTPTPTPTPNPTPNPTRTMLCYYWTIWFK